MTLNPLLAPWTTRFELPPFDRVGSEHFRPAFEQGMSEQKQAVRAIAEDPAPPLFENTLAALERSGRTLDRVAAVFFNLAGAHTSEALQEIEREIAPKLAKHGNAIFQDADLFRRVDGLTRDDAVPELTSEQRRVLERYRRSFVRAGAALGADEKRRLAESSERLATLGTAFGQNVLADESAYRLVLEGEEDLAGLPDFLRAAAARAAEERGLPDRHVITLLRSSIEPFLQFSTRRDLRERAFRAWVARGDTGGPTDNNAIIRETVALRAEWARLLGYPSFAHFKLDDTMAKTPDAVFGLLRDVWPPALRRAEEERAALEKIAAEGAGRVTIEPWDWRFYAEKLRRARFALDEAETKPYFQLERMIEAAFYTAGRLFGLTFEEVRGLPLYHPDVRVWEVRHADGRHVGLFLGDYFARPSKRSGAWMSRFREQERLDGEVPPIIVNVMNFSKGAEGEPALLSFDDARTLFHEFGHGLHGLLSDVTYPTISGTSVLQDFVELPSQLYEHWLEERAVLQRFAIHYRTGEPIPDELLDRVLAARNFNQGCATLEYVSSAFMDLEAHLLDDTSGLDAQAFERSTLERVGMPREIVPRHRMPHFAHVFSGDSYAAGYYSYLWSEVLDADAFQAFRETGDIFDPDTAKRLRDHIYAAGGSREPGEAYRAFRGRMPTVEGLLAQRGLDAGAQPARPG